MIGADEFKLVEQLRAAGCVFAEEEAALLLAQGFARPQLDDAVARRVAGAPLEHVLGWVTFAGMRIPVGPGVFVPRRRTELVARLASELAVDRGIVVDLCCGAGAIGAAIAVARPDVKVVAADIDPVAVGFASALLESAGGRVHLSDMDATLADLEGAVSVVASCPPYVPTAHLETMPREAREHEPRLALDGGADGIELQRRVFEAAVRLLTAGGHAVVETTASLAEATLAAATNAGLAASVTTDDALEATVVVAKAM